MSPGISPSSGIRKRKTQLSPVSAKCLSCSPRKPRRKSRTIFKIVLVFNLTLMLKAFLKPLMMNWPKGATKEAKIDIIVECFCIGLY